MTKLKKNKSFEFKLVPLKIRYKNKVSINIPRVRKTLKVMKCKLCDNFKSTISQTGGNNLSQHLRVAHDIQFDKSQSQSSKLNNTYLLLGYYDEVEVKDELFWICPYCKHEYMITNAGKKNIHIQIHKHLDYCKERKEKHKHLEWQIELNNKLKNEK